MSESKKRHFNIFYSWQSDINKKANNHFIKDCLEKAIKEINKDAKIEIIPRLDKDTQGASGSPKIIDTILKKIDVSDMLIADVTLINKNWVSRLFKYKLTPNPNVLFELGYALPRLKWDRIICLNNNAFSDISDMPFDLHQNRLSTYYFDGRKDKQKVKEDLTKLLKQAIEAVINNYDVIMAEEQKENVHKHDTQIFKGFDDIIDDEKFLDKLEFIGRNHMIRGEYDLFYKMEAYLKAEKNQFLIPELKEYAIELRAAIYEMHSTFATTLQSKTESYWDDTEGKMITQTIYQLPQNEQYFDSHKEYEANKKDKIDKNTKSVNAAIESYRQFRAEVKRHLYI